MISIAYGGGKLAANRQAPLVTSDDGVIGFDSKRGRVELTMSITNTLGFSATQFTAVETHYGVDST